MRVRFRYYSYKIYGKVEGFVVFDGNIRLVKISASETRSSIEECEKRAKAIVDALQNGCGFYLRDGGLTKTNEKGRRYSTKHLTETPTSTTAICGSKVERSPFSFFRNVDPDGVEAGVNCERCKKILSSRR